MSTSLAAIVILAWVASASASETSPAQGGNEPELMDVVAEACYSVAGLAAAVTETALPAVGLAAVVVEVASTFPVCGDRRINSAAEQCDGPDDANCPGACTLNCTCPPCGNGIVDPGETCATCLLDLSVGRPDADVDGLADSCDCCTDLDLDGYRNPGFSPPPICALGSLPCPIDNCPEVYNPDQLNDDGDALGNACDPCPQQPVCPPPTGACCYDRGRTCTMATLAACIAPRPTGLGGCYLGNGTTCPTIAGRKAKHRGRVVTHYSRPPIDCRRACTPAAATSSGPCSGSGPYYDAWETVEELSLCHDFGAPETEPIPADFFGPGSDPFYGVVCFGGVPLGLPEHGDADTLIQRSDDPFDRCALPSDVQVTVDIDIVALNLASLAPLTVTYNGGTNAESWDVTVDLAPDGRSPATPQSTLTAVKSHCSGGTYTSDLYVQPRFTFEKLGMTRVLDTFFAGLAAVHLEQSSPHPWVQQVDPLVGASVDPCSSFHPGFEETAPRDDCDCNGNGEVDECDIHSGQSVDSDGNGIPDECVPPIPTLTQWGVIVMMGLFLCGGTIVFRRVSRTKGQELDGV